MATYTFTCPDAADSIMREVALVQGWDGVSDFGAFMQQMFLQYTTDVCASVKSQEAGLQASLDTDKQVRDTFSPPATTVTP